MIKLLQNNRYLFNLTSDKNSWNDNILFVFNFFSHNLNIFLLRQFRSFYRGLIKSLSKTNYAKNSTCVINDLRNFVDSEASTRCITWGKNSHLTAVLSFLLIWNLHVLFSPFSKKKQKTKLSISFQKCFSWSQNKCWKCYINFVYLALELSYLTKYRFCQKQFFSSAFVMVLSIFYSKSAPMEVKCLCFLKFCFSNKSSHVSYRETSQSIASGFFGFFS